MQANLEKITKPKFKFFHRLKPSVNVNKDKDHKFNFFTKSQKRKLRASPLLGILASMSLFAYMVPVTYQQEVLTAQNTLVSTAGSTFVITPYNMSSRNEGLAYWVENQEPGMQLTPEEVQKIVNIMPFKEIKK